MSLQMRKMQPNVVIMLIQRQNNIHCHKCKAMMGIKTVTLVQPAPCEL